LVAVCLGVSAFQVATLLISYGLMLSRVVGVGLGQLAEDLLPALTASLAMLAVVLPVAQALSEAGLPSAAVLALAGVLSAPLYLLGLRFASPAAWDDLMLLTRKMLGRGGSRKARRMRLEGSPAASG
jgi:hypothetical protein